MIILAHRGYWINAEEKNTPEAFTRSFENGFGVETDLRDTTGKLFISHDMATGNEMTVDDFFTLYNTWSSSLALALNVKADGLQKVMATLLRKNKIDNYFFFDMSLPDAIGYLKEGLKIYSRQSEFEKEPYLYKEAQGIWLDEFDHHWINEEIITYHIRQEKRICIVSPELHKRNYREEWQHYKYIINKLGIENLMLCTDHPGEAQIYFNT